MTKLFPNNTHMNHYEGWHYLGSDDKHDYYVLPWDLVGKDHRLTFSTPWLSIVYGNWPHEYMSPDYKHLLSGDYDSVFTDVPEYKHLKMLLLNNGYHLTGKSDSNDD